MSSGLPLTNFPTCNVINYTNTKNRGAYVERQSNKFLHQENISSTEKTQLGLAVLNDQQINVLNNPQYSNFTINNFHNISEPRVLSEVNINNNSILNNNFNNTTSSLVLDYQNNFNLDHSQRGPESPFPHLQGLENSFQNVEDSFVTGTTNIAQVQFMNGTTNCNQLLHTRASSEESNNIVGPSTPGIRLELYKEKYSLNAGVTIDENNSRVKVKEHKLDSIPAWSELKTKAGKERKRLPLACVACRRKKIRCSGEKPACKHCLRSKVPCVYKVTTRKPTPRTDYMALLDKRIKRMEERIFKIIPRENYDTNNNNCYSGPRSIVKPKIYRTPARNIAGRKRLTEEAFEEELGVWTQATPEPSIKEIKQRKNNILGIKSIGNELMTEGANELPTEELQKHLAEVFFENIEGQVYHLLHKPSFMERMRSNSIPPVLVLAICAISARFSTHPIIKKSPYHLRGEKWAAVSRSIVIRRYEYPDVTIVICLLILSLHESGTCQRERNWSLGGMAIRMALALDLHQDLDHDPMNADHEKKLGFIDRESRKRIMWACFAMDRLESSGRNRPPFISENIINLQLPIKEKYFIQGIPGQTEYLNESIGYISSSKVDEISDTKSNMDVSAYLLRVIAIWGRVSQYVYSSLYPHHESTSQGLESLFQSLDQQLATFHETLPENLKYNMENLSIHNTEGLANQFILLHIYLQQNILFLNRFALLDGGRKDLESRAFKEANAKKVAKSFAAADEISRLLENGNSYFISAPFVGYCAFFAGIVHILGIFSEDLSRKEISKTNLIINMNYLSRGKKHWMILKSMHEYLQDQWTICSDTNHSSKEIESSPIMSFQYSDLLDLYCNDTNMFNSSEETADFKKEITGDEKIDSKVASYRVEREGSHYTIKPFQNIGLYNSTRKSKKSPPAPLITNSTMSGNFGTKLNPQCVLQNYGQISPITPVNIYDQQHFHNPSYLFPEFQQVNLPQSDRTPDFDSFCCVDLESNVHHMSGTSPTWGTTQIIEGGSVDSRILNQSSGFNGPWLLPYSMDSVDLDHEQDIFPPMHESDTISSKWQDISNC
ncbi:putative zinc finger transcription factor 1 [Erysiphe necator]|uniref:Putative zinc finger transcription factor 1 n=1 Tax=Uncinula necator TaxID=52586 RepID=A0A0B1NZY9_UNCNE|nr:putative zinc finger transcription factor 1 [Erysiphe necator]